MGAAFEISVIVPAYRAEETIAACLASLARQREAPPFEVIVVDSSPDEATSRAARALARSERGAGLDLRLERLPERSFAGPARNRGAALARAPRLLFLDADCRASPGLLRAACAALDEDGAFVGGAIGRGGPRAISARLRHLLEFKGSLPGSPPRSTWELPSACLACRREAFLRSGGYPPTRAAEDWRLHWRLWREGERLRFDPRLRVEHATRAGWLALARYSLVLGEASGAARRDDGLPGQAFVRHPWLAVLLPFGRTARALSWCARHHRGELAFLLLAWPAYLAFAAIWAWGFHRGVRGAASSGLARSGAAA